MKAIRVVETHTLRGNGRDESSVARSVVQYFIDDEEGAEMTLLAERDGCVDEFVGKMKAIPVGEVKLLALDGWFVVCPLASYREWQDGTWRKRFETGLATD